MIALAHKISTLIVLAIGVTHTAATFVFFDNLDESAVWFAGAGLCAVFAALLNVCLWRRDVSTLTTRCAAAANFFFFFWLVSGVTATPGPPTYLVGGIGAAMVICATTVIARPSHPENSDESRG